MNNISNVTVEAGVLALPSDACSEDEAYKYIETLNEFAKLRNERWVSIYISDKACESLYADGLFPSRDQLKRLIKTHHIQEYDAKTVATRVDSLLAVASSFEAHYRIKDILLDLFKTTPDVANIESFNVLKYNMECCVTLIAILHKYCHQLDGGNILFLREAPKNIIRVIARIQDIEHERDDIHSIPCPPECFEGEVLACDNFTGFIECLDEAAILANATNNYGIEISIRIALFKYALEMGKEPKWNQTLAPAIGPDFFNTCQHCCRGQSEALPRRILRAIGETIYGHNLSDVHALRTSGAGNAPQRMRNKDKAQRRDIDRTFHLHYWDCADGTIELASVVFHDNFSIPK